MEVLLHCTFNLDADEEASMNIPRRHAESHLDIPGLIWKIWIKDPDSRLNGGTHLFADRGSAEVYLDNLRARFAQRPDISDFSATIFEIKTEASLITRAPISAPTGSDAVPS